jgi:peptide/nickel transport system substrate-binding protein
MRLKSIVTALALAVLLVACAGPAPTGSTGRQEASGPAVSRGPKRIVAAIQGEPVAFSTTINPSGSAGSVPGSDALEDLLHAGLANHDNEGRLVARLAEAVPSVENGLWRVLPDGRMETTWRLRPGAEWHDGRPLTSEDLLFTLRVGREREIGLFWNPAYEGVESVEAPDPQTIVVRWSRPYVDADMMFTRQLAMPLPRHLLSGPYEEERAGFVEHPYWLGDFVGAGPFKLRSYQPGSHLILAANERYALGRPRVDEVEVKFIPDAHALITSVVAGAAELTMGARISLDLAVQAGDQWRDGKVDHGPGGWVTIYPQFLNPQPAVVAELRFRRALLHAIDRQELVDNLMFGRSTVIQSPVAPNHPGYKETEASQVRYDFDPRRTALLLEELGYVRGGDGFYFDATGQRLLVENRATAQTDIQPKALTAVADYWRRAGVAVDELVVPNQRVPDREYRHSRPAFEVLSSGNDPGNFASFHSSRIPLPANNFVGANRSRYANPELDALIDRYYVTIPWQERMQVLGQIVHHFSDRLVVMGLFFNTSRTLVGNRLVNVAVRGPFSTEAWNAHEWDVR